MPELAVGLADEVTVLEIRKTNQKELVAVLVAAAVVEEVVFAAVEAVVVMFRALPAVPPLVANFLYPEQKHLDLVLDFDLDLVAAAVVVIVVVLGYVQQ